MPSAGALKLKTCLGVMTWGPTCAQFLAEPASTLPKSKDARAGGDEYRWATNLALIKTLKTQIGTRCGATPAGAAVLQTLRSLCSSAATVSLPLAAQTSAAAFWPGALRFRGRFTGRSPYSLRTRAPRSTVWKTQIRQALSRAGGLAAQVGRRKSIAWDIVARWTVERRLPHIYGAGQSSDEARIYRRWQSADSVFNVNI
jgi:hypothetical protein